MTFDQIESQYLAEPEPQPYRCRVCGRPINKCECERNEDINENYFNR
jgi:hypothetical protein